MFIHQDSSLPDQKKAVTDDTNVIHQDSSLPDQKKAVTDYTNVVADQSSSVGLSQELQDTVMTNRLTAKMKLTNKQTRGLVRDLGPSWFAALESEFTKPYFQQVEFQAVVNGVLYTVHIMCVCQTLTLFIKNVYEAEPSNL